MSQSLNCNNKASRNVSGKVLRLFSLLRRRGKKLIDVLDEGMYSGLSEFEGLNCGVLGNKINGK